MKAILTWLNKLFTDKDGDADEIPILATIIVIVYCGLEMYDVVHNHKPFDAQGFGVGSAALLGAVTTALGIRSKMEGQTTP